tara:strand:- start:948 stop:1082 length:135 start_codon:yes stop_codon:yes gene_type:complete
MPCLEIILPIVIAVAGAITALSETLPFMQNKWKRYYIIKHRQVE